MFMFYRDLICEVTLPPAGGVSEETDHHAPERNLTQTKPK